jgi:hypothetical protein
MLGISFADSERVQKIIAKKIKKLFLNSCFQSFIPLPNIEKEDIKRIIIILAILKGLSEFKFICKQARVSKMIKNITDEAM